MKHPEPCCLLLSWSLEWAPKSVSARLYHALYEHFRAAAERIAWWVFLNHPCAASLSQESSMWPTLEKTMAGELEIEFSAAVDLVVSFVFAPDPHAFASVERVAVVAVSASLTHEVREPESSLPPCDRRSVIPRKQRTRPLNLTMENKTIASLHTIGTNSLFLCFGILSNRVRADFFVRAAWRRATWTPLSWKTSTTTTRS